MGKVMWNSSDKNNRSLKRRLLTHIAEAPALLSLLYDSNLLPEQLEEKTEDKGFMYGLAYMHLTLQIAKKDITQAYKTPCTCSSFVRQYEGCCCEKAKAVATAKAFFWDLLGGCYAK